MNSSWVAATVRARAMARRRVGLPLTRRVAEAASLESGLALLTGTAFERAAAPGMSLLDAEHGIRAELLWELRVLAGWMPAAGTVLARSLAARFEQSNVERHRDRIAGRGRAPMFVVGTLATSWPRLAATTSLDDLRGELAASPWADPGEPTATGLHDALTLGWLRMVATASAGIPVARRWVAGGAALLAARTAVAFGHTPSDAMARAAAPLIGRQWARARSIGELRAALPAAARWALAGIAEPAELWRAEARARAVIESDGFRLVRGAHPGPEPVLGALALLAVDGWRLRAALASAAAGGGATEVLDVVA